MKVSVIHGFGETRVFHTISLAFKDSSRKAVFLSRDIAENEDAGDIFKYFM